MKIKGKTISIRTLALMAALLLCLTSGGVMASKAQLAIFSDDYIADFELDHLQVHLMENGVDVCHGENDMITVHREDNGGAKKEKYRGNLLEYMGYTNDTHFGSEAAYRLGTPGTVEPGRTYDEKICARNGQNIDQYVRLTVRKYWVDPEGRKATYLSPDLIHLTYNGKACNTEAWQINPREHTAESDTYYLTRILKAEETSPLLFNELTIDKSIVDNENLTRTETREGNKIVYHYEYDYDGYKFFLEADVQAIQTHNANAAIDSLWGVGNVSATNGVVTVSK